MIKNAIKISKRYILGRVRLLQLTLFNRKIQLNKAGFFCGRNCFISTKNEFKIGKNFYMGNYCHLSSNAVIGNDVMFASFVSLVGGDHVIDNIDTVIRLSGRDELRQITIEDNVWIGHGAIIIHGVTIKTGAVIAAGSVVTKNVGKNEIVGGNPAKLIRKRKINPVKNSV